jgi:hypothetical protein
MSSVTYISLQNMPILGKQQRNNIGRLDGNINTRHSTPTKLSLTTIRDFVEKLCVEEDNYIGRNPCRHQFNR